MKNNILIILILMANFVFGSEYTTYSATVDEICYYDDQQCKRPIFSLGKDVVVTFTLYKSFESQDGIGIVLGPEKIKNTLSSNQRLFYSCALFDKNGAYLGGEGDLLSVDASKEQEGYQVPTMMPKTELDKVKKLIVKVYSYGDDRSHIKKLKCESDGKGGVMCQ